MPPICPFSVGYHPLLSDSADDGVHCLAARLAARSALAQLHIGGMVEIGVFEVLAALRFESDSSIFSR